MTRIVHFSDWHANFRPLPEADIYVCTGDMLPNFLRVKARDARRFSDYYFDKGLEQVIQKRWIREQLGSFKQYLASPDAPVVCVRGNHDFCDLELMFDGCDVHEIKEAGDEFVIDGLKFSGFRGINYIAGAWNDELHGDEQGFRATKVPRDVDVIVTHAPPHGILDYILGGGNLGMQPLSEILNKKSYDNESYPKLKLMCFGHIHEQGGVVSEAEAEEIGVRFSNASCNTNVIDI